MSSTMMLVTSNWGEKKTFKMLPITSACPYNEVIFDPEAKILAVISKDKKQSLHMLAKLNDNGDPIMLKVAKRENGKDYQEERKLLESYYEYYIQEPEEVKEFISLTAVNAATFDYDQYLTASVIAKPTPGIVTPV